MIGPVREKEVWVRRIADCWAWSGVSGVAARKECEDNVMERKGMSVAVEG
jgi:hypothetical protein